ncbi:MAG TPA: hypothetical protein VIC24_06430 [Gemmatimonadaceae bacterium]
MTAASGFQAIPGQGARATVGGRQVHVGGPALGRALSLDVPAALGAAAGRARDRGQAAIFLVEDGAIVAVFAEPMCCAPNRAPRWMRCTKRESTSS